MVAESSISFDGETIVNGGSGPVAIGNQAEIIIQIGNYLSGRPATFWPEGRVRELLRCYVPPVNHDHVVKVLSDDSVVIVTGDRGSGRTAAAIAAMRALHPGVRIVGLDPDASPGTDGLMGSAPGYLHRAAPGRIRAHEVLDAWNRTRVGGAMLAIVTDEAGAAVFQSASDGAGEPRTVAIERPDPMEVYQRRLEVRGLGDTSWWDWIEGREMLSGQLPGAARRLADIVEGVQRSGAAEADQRSQAAQAFRGWADELAAWFDEHQDRSYADRRMLMVAAAALAPAPVRDVYSAAAVLGEMLNVAPSGGGLVWEPAGRIDQLLSAKLAGSTLTFSRPYFADAVLDHVWNEYTLGHDHVFAWLADLPLRGEIDPAALRRVALKYTAFAAARRDGVALVATAQRWAEHGRYEAAFVALSAAVTDPFIGGAVRRESLDRIWRRRAGRPLEWVLLRVCEGLGETHLPLALTRLKWLITHDDDVMRDEARTVIAKLGSNPERRREITANLLEPDQQWFRGKKFPNRPQAASRVFLEFAGRMAVDGDAGVPEILTYTASLSVDHLANGWRGALETTPEEQEDDLSETLFRWLDTASATPDLADLITAALIDGTHFTRGRATRRLRRLIGGWVARHGDDPNRRKVRDRILFRLREPGDPRRDRTR